MVDGKLIVVCQDEEIEVYVSFGVLTHISNFFKALIEHTDAGEEAYKRRHINVYKITVDFRKISVLQALDFALKGILPSQKRKETKNTLRYFFSDNFISNTLRHITRRIVNKWEKNSEKSEDPVHLIPYLHEEWITKKLRQFICGYFYDHFSKFIYQTEDHSSFSEYLLCNGILPIPKQFEEPYLFFRPPRAISLLIHKSARRYDEETQEEILFPEGTMFILFKTGSEVAGNGFSIRFVNEPSVCVILNSEKYEPFSPDLYLEVNFITSPSVTFDCSGRKRWGEYPILFPILQKT